MPQHLPIACTLDPTDFERREALIAQLGRDALLSTTRDATRAELHFAASEGIRARVDAFVAGESNCCAFLAMNVTERDDEIVLRIASPTDAVPVLAELVAAFQPQHEATR